MSRTRPSEQDYIEDNSPETSDEKRALYQQKIQAFEDKIDAIHKKEKSLLLLSTGGAYREWALKQLFLADDMLNLVLYQLKINAVFTDFYNVRSEKALNEGRKTIYKFLIYLENVVTGGVDVPYSNYSDKLDEIASFTAEQRYRLVEKGKKTIALLKNAYGENTKWKWSFVDLDGRFAAVAKNFLDQKKIVLNTDPSAPDYEPTVRHLWLVKELLDHAAGRYREKYELSTKRRDDFQAGINFLGALFRIHALVWEKDEATEVKKKKETWTARLEADVKNKKAHTR